MLQIILVQDFCPLKIKITQCPGEFRLNILWTYEEGKAKISGANSRVLHSFRDTGGSPLNKVLLFLSFQEALSRIGAKVSKIKGPEINAF